MKKAEKEKFIEAIIENSFEHEHEKEVLRMIHRQDERQILRDFLWYYNERVSIDDFLTQWHETAIARAEEWQEIADRLDIMRDDERYERAKFYEGKNI